eukprot:254227_1
MAESLTPILHADHSSASGHRTPRAPRRSITPRQALDTLELGLTQANDLQHLFENYKSQIEKQSIAVQLNIDKQFDHIMKELMQRKEALRDQVTAWKTQKCVDVEHELQDAVTYEEALLKAQNKCKDILNDKTLDTKQKKQQIKSIRNAVSVDTQFKKYKDSKKVTDYVNTVTNLIDIEYGKDVSLDSISKYGHIISDTSSSTHLSVPTLNLMKPIKARESKSGYKLKLKWSAPHSLIGSKFIVRCLTVQDDEKQQTPVWKALKFELKESNHEVYDRNNIFEASGIDSVFLFDKTYAFRVEYDMTDPVNLLIASNEQYFTVENAENQPPSSNKADYIELEYVGCKGFSYEGHPEYLLSDDKAKMYRSKHNREFDYGENDWIVFALKHSGFIRQYLPKAIMMMNSDGTQALREMIVSVGEKKDGKDWLKYNMIRLEDNADEYQQILLEGVDWRDVKQMKTQYIRLEFINNHGEARNTQCRFKVHEFQLYGLEFN